MDDIFMPNRNHYGTWSDDDDELAAAVTGKSPVKRSPGVSHVSDEREGEIVDENFLRSLLTDSEHKYGRA